MNLWNFFFLIEDAEFYMLFLLKKLNFQIILFKRPKFFQPFGFMGSKCETNSPMVLEKQRESFWKTFRKPKLKINHQIFVFHLWNRKSDACTVTSSHRHHHVLNICHPATAIINLVLLPPPICNLKLEQWRQWELHGGIQKSSFRSN